MARPRLIVFSDLDGTLLDHHTYRWTEAETALARLRDAGIPVVLNSSKTAAEIEVIREAMGNRDPYIVENGAAVVMPAGSWGQAEERVVHFGADRGRILRALNALRQNGAKFRGFEDLSAPVLAQMTGLDESAATRAKRRFGTEPIVWDGTASELTVFRSALADEGLVLVKGGRFWHVMGNIDKAEGARFLLDHYRKRCGHDDVLSIGLGDSPNDQRMLDIVDIPVVVRGVNSDQVRLSSDRHAIRSLRPGPQGWNDCVLNLLVEYGY